MAEHDSEREDREERENRGAQDARGRRDDHGERDGHREQDGHGEHESQDAGVSFDEDAAWAAIVAGYGEEPPDPPGAKPFKTVEDLALPAAEPNDDKPEEKQPARPLGSSVSFAPALGPRDYTAPEASEDDFDEDDEGHFVPPEPPPLPDADTTARFAWLGVVGGPILLLVAVVLGWDMTWWLTTLGVGGFLGGFATLVVRMRTDDEDDGDPGRGAVV
ncbi:hypothetical protein ACFV5G_03635 [Streptomyces sp. NPDC059766]|uniref:hypothetical protein n=1 Tax=Streptomyces sp. NPDC059766 TaxID=3346940 RepID=UPI00365FBCD0